MAMSWQIDSAAATAKTSGPSPTFNETNSPVLANPRAREDTELRERRRAARALIRLGRTPDDPNSDVLLEMCGLSHYDAMPLSTTEETTC